MIVYKPKFMDFVGYYLGRPAKKIKSFLAYVYFWPMAFLDSARSTFGNLFGNRNRYKVDEILIGIDILYLLCICFLLSLISLWLVFLLIVFTVVVLKLADISRHYLISDYVKMRKPFRIKFKEYDEFRFECKRDWKLFLNDIYGNRMAKWKDKK